MRHSCFVYLHRIVYSTPEFVHSCPELLLDLLPPFRLCLVAVDEAHCVSHWGPDFREAYRRLDELRRRYADTPFLALTATATQDVVSDICSSLCLKQPKVSKSSFDRPNLVGMRLMPSFKISYNRLC